MVNRLFGFLVVVGAALGVGGADEPVGWRMNGASAFPNAAPPLQWSENSNVVWKTRMPKFSNASPIVVGNRLFVCAESNTLICVNKKTGAILWQKETPSSAIPAAGASPATHNVNGYTTPTPVSDGKSVYVLFGTGVAAAYSLDGSCKWIGLVARPQQGWGHSSSPLLDDGKLFVVVENTAAALSLADGSVLWKTNGVQAWGSPVLLCSGRQRLAFSAGGWAYSLADGVVAAKLPKLEYNSALAADGYLYCIQGNSKAYAIKQGAGGATVLEEIWSTALAKNRYYASPALYDGLIYAVMLNGVLSVIDAKTGERTCEKKLDLGGTCYPSIVVAGDHVFVSSDSGRTLVLTSGRDPSPVATNSLEAFRSTPVFEGKRIYVRGSENLYCIGASSR